MRECRCDAVGMRRVSKKCQKGCCIIPLSHADAESTDELFREINTKSGAMDGLWIGSAGKSLNEMNGIANREDRDQTESSIKASMV